MRTRDFAFLVVGLIFGLLVGVILLGSTGLGSALLGTAGIRPQADPVYYLVDLEESETWLTDSYVDEADAISQAFNNVAQLVTTENFAQTVLDTQDDIDLIISRSFTALTGTVGDQLDAVETTLPVPTPAATPQPLLQSLSDGNVSACLGLDENPYNIDGYALYLYVEVPETQAQFLPESWTQLEVPKEDDLFWQRLACQVQQTQEVERSR